MCMHIPSILFPQVKLSTSRAPKEKSSPCQTLAAFKRLVGSCAASSHHFTDLELPILSPNKYKKYWGASKTYSSRVCFMRLKPIELMYISLVRYVFSVLVL